MLLTSRVDYITAMLPDAVLVFDELGEPLPAFNTELVFLESNIGFVCHRTPETETFVEAMNARITQLANNRAYQVRLERAGIWSVPDREEDKPRSLKGIAPAAGKRAPLAQGDGAPESGGPGSGDSDDGVAEAHPRPTGLGPDRGHILP